MLLELLASIIEEVIYTGYVPLQWRGGGLAKLVKGKGEHIICDFYRGLLIIDHASKAFIGVITPPVKEAVEGGLPQQQWWCPQGWCQWGSSLGGRLHHRECIFLRSQLQFYFWGLTKAFDRLVRQFAFGAKQAGQSATAIKEVM
ncbi:MAG: hypothetical protein ACKPKO_61790, partial [Candidatus Fonsibacter sp.]